MKNNQIQQPDDGMGTNQFIRMFGEYVKEEPLRSIYATRPTIWGKMMDEISLATSLADIKPEYINLLKSAQENRDNAAKGRIRRARVFAPPAKTSSGSKSAILYSLQTLDEKSERFFCHPFCATEEIQKKGMPRSAEQHNPNAFAESRALRILSSNGKKVALNTDLSIKVGLIESNDPVVRALQGAASVAIPGDLSNLRKPIRSNLYEALTPGPPGLPNRPRLLRRALARGERNQLRCPPGFEGGGRFAKKDLSNCGLRIFDLPGFGLVPIGQLGGLGRGKKPNVGEAIRGVGIESETTNVRDPGSVAPIEGTPTGPNVAAASDIDISRIALINTVGELNAQAREDAIEKAIPVAVKVNSADFGRLVRKDGTMLDNVVPLVRLADVRNSEDMEQGFLVTSITDPDKFAVDEFQVFSAGLDGIVMATPDGKGFIRLEKVPGAGSIRGMRRRWGTIVRDQPEGMPGYAFDQLVQESGKKLRLSVQYPGIQNPLEMIEIERDGAKRTVRKWVYALFLSSEAPMRPKSLAAWKLVEDAVDDRKKTEDKK